MIRLERIIKTVEQMTNAVLENLPLTVQDKRGQKRVDINQINRAHTQGHKLAKIADAFDKLGLATEEEKRYYTERLAFYLFESLYIAYKGGRKRTLDGKNELLDYEAMHYFGGVKKVESTFHESDSIAQRGVKRAMDLAAKATFFIIEQDLITLGQTSIFAQGMRSLITLPDEYIASQKIDLQYNPSGEARNQLERVFEIYRRDLALFRGEAFISSQHGDQEFLPLRHPEI